MRAAQNISAQALNAIKKNGQLLGFSRSARELALRCGTGPFFPKKVFFPQTTSTTNNARRPGLINNLPQQKISDSEKIV